MASSSIDEGPSICKICKSTFTPERFPADVGAHHEGFTITHHRTCSSLLQSGSHGSTECWICSRLLASLWKRQGPAILKQAELDKNRGKKQTSWPPFKYTEERHSVPEGYLFMDDEPEDFIEALLAKDTTPAQQPGWILAFNVLRLNAKPGDGKKRMIYRTFYLQKVNGHQSIDVIDRLPESTKSPEAFSLARRWLKECSTEHKQCGPASEKPVYYPTRLLDCGPFQNKDASCILIETKGVALAGPYMTLSHCWGTTECLKLTTDNHTQLIREGITSSSLPQLYRDAVETTRRFGVRYLWIDSLCIIQHGDELRDWKREAKSMGEVYRHSYCNISAADLTDSKESLFTNRSPSSISPLTVNLVNGDMYRVTDTDFWSDEVSKAIINTRGWVLQERILSPRILYFAARQMLWECREKDAAETYPNGLPPEVPSAYFNSGFKEHALRRPPPGQRETSNFTGYISWNKIISTYTECNLTVSSDKLVALSGVAKEMETILEDRYVVGMWRRHLEFSLLWFVNVGCLRPRPTTFRAPTWSWASIDGSISTYNPSPPEKAHLHYQVMGYELDYETDDHTGLVRGGWLDLRGTLKRLELHCIHPPTGRTCGDWRMTIDKVEVSVPDNSPLSNWQPRLLLDACADDLEEKSRKGTLYCMPTQVLPWWESNGIKMLVLEVVDEKFGVFRRIGLASGWGDVVKHGILNEENNDYDHDAINDGVKSPDHSFSLLRSYELPCRDFRDGLHVIRVV